jgi:hypothetical protein
MSAGGWRKQQALLQLLPEMDVVLKLATRMELSVSGMDGYGCYGQRWMGMGWIWVSPLPLFISDAAAAAAAVVCVLPSPHYKT